MNDVIVVGAGPAGSTTATWLARRGHRVLLLERSSFPRDKLCGEFLSADGVAELEELDVASLLEGTPRMQQHRVTTFHHGRRHEILGRLVPDARGISRRRLDAGLVRAAGESGVDVREGFRVLRVDEIDDDARRVVGLSEAGDEAHVARVVIDASGRLGLQRHAAPGPARQLAFQQHFKVARGDGPVGVELHSFPGGYLGLAPIEDGRVNACGLVEARLHAGHVRTAEDLFALAARCSPDAAERLAGLVPDGEPRSTVRDPTRARERPGSRWQVGDAASSIAPLCGDGMAMALTGGRLLAETVSEVLNGKLRHAEARRRHARARSSAFRSRLLLGRLLEHCLVRPSWTGPVLRAGRAWPGLIDALVRGTRGRVIA
ncbi:MAG: NAD(P)/FAD-dependent oxidoreductase [Acidobacteriota bacterium]